VDGVLGCELHAASEWMKKAETPTRMNLLDR
jgi:hypothetical protein